MYGIKEKLQTNAIHKRIRERNDFDKKIKNVELQIKQKLNNFDWYILVNLNEMSKTKKTPSSKHTRKKLGI